MTGRVLREMKAERYYAGGDMCKSQVADRAQICIYSLQIKFASFMHLLSYVYQFLYSILGDWQDMSTTFLDRAQI